MGKTIREEIWLRPTTQQKQNKLMRSSNNESKNSLNIKFLKEERESGEIYLLGKRYQVRSTNEPKKTSKA